MLCRLLRTLGQSYLLGKRLVDKVFELFIGDHVSCVVPQDLNNVKILNCAVL